MKEQRKKISYVNENVTSFLVGLMQKQGEKLSRVHKNTKLNVKGLTKNTNGVKLSI